MGFGFLPQEHNRTSGQNTGGQELPLSLQSNSQEHGFDPGIACKTSNALASSSRLPDESSSDVVQRPYVFDQLYSWEDLMMRGGSDTWVNLRILTGLDTVTLLTRSYSLSHRYQKRNAVILDPSLFLYFDGSAIRLATLFFHTA
jgi:hypothetical protein